MTDRLLTTREVAELLALSTESVLRRWRRGEIPGGIRLASNVLRFRESELHRWLDELEAGVAPSGISTHTQAVPDCARRGSRCEDAGGPGAAGAIGVPLGSREEPNAS